MTALWVALGAAAGAPLRYLVDRAVQSRHSARFPWGTFAVNVAGSFALGLVTGLSTPAVVAAAVGTGFCGALTTYSTFGYETFALAEQRAFVAATANMAGSVAAGIASAAVGYLVGQVLI